MKKNIFNTIKIFSITFLVAIIFAGATCEIDSVKDIFPSGSPETYTKESATFTVKAFANGMIGASATIALIFLIYGGIQYITSAGNQEQAGKAKNTITWAIIGFLVIILSYSIVNYVLVGLFK